MSWDELVRFKTHMVLMRATLQAEGHCAYSLWH